MKYFNYCVTGLYLRKDNRLIATIKDKTTKKKSSVSFPKLIMELYMNERFPKNITVDHIDGDPLNNNLSNLQIVGLKEHTKMDSPRNLDVKAVCFMCNEEFTIKGSTLSSRDRKDRKYVGFFCSKTCSGKYGKAIQNGDISVPDVPRKVLERPKYKLKMSAQREISEVELLKFGEVLDKFKDRLMMIIPSQASKYLFTDKLLEGVETKQEAPKS